MRKTASHRFISGLLIGFLVLFILGLGCGSAADVDAKSCCQENPSCHRGSTGGEDPNKCCQENQQAKPKISADSHAALAKKALESAFLHVGSFENWNDSIHLTVWDAPPLPVFKLPQQDLYQLTSTLLI
jgi:hypothetical protein